MNRAVIELKSLYGNDTTYNVDAIGVWTNLNASLRRVNRNVTVHPSNYWLSAKEVSEKWWAATRPITWSLIHKSWIKNSRRCDWFPPSFILNDLKLDGTKTISQLTLSEKCKLLAYFNWIAHGVLDEESVITQVSVSTEQWNEGGQSDKVKDGGHFYNTIGAVLEQTNWLHLRNPSLRKTNCVDHCLLADIIRNEHTTESVSSMVQRAADKILNGKTPDDLDGKTRRVYDATMRSRDVIIDGLEHFESHLTLDLHRKMMTLDNGAICDYANAVIVDDYHSTARSR
jgi:hypothetical protein